MFWKKKGDPHPLGVPLGDLLSRSCCTKAATHSAQVARVPELKNPIVGTLPGCCAQRQAARRPC
jgi:hypothetical protein